MLRGEERPQLVHLKEPTIMCDIHVLCVVRSKSELASSILVLRRCTSAGEGLGQRSNIFLNHLSGAGLQGEQHVSQISITHLTHEDCNGEFNHTRQRMRSVLEFNGYI